MPEKTVLITGCSDGGLGAAMAKAYHAQGFRVFAGLRNVAKAGSLRDMKGITLVRLDVISNTSIQSCVEEVQKLTGGKLDILVNNAGVPAVMPLLDFPIDDAKAIYDTNVWGVLAMSQAFAPMLINAGGIICNIGSGMGETVPAWLGIYSSSKAAVKTISETLRIEMAPLGVRVMTVILGGVTTNMNDASMIDDLVLPEGSYYNQIWGVINSHKKVEQFSGLQKVDVAAANIVSDVLGSNGAIFSRRGTGATLLWIASCILPHGIVVAMLNRGAGLAELAASKLKSA